MLRLEQHFRLAVGRIEDHPQFRRLALGLLFGIVFGHDDHRLAETEVAQAGLIIGGRFMHRHALPTQEIAEFRRPLDACHPDLAALAARLLFADDRRHYH